jgi:pSer/pThr/pTyr-binding forkhead associated (FHA) protein
MDDHRTISVSRVYVPNEYVLYLSPKDREQFRGYEHSLLEELAGYLSEHARREGYALVAAVRVLLEEDEDLAVGEFGIATRLVQPEPVEAPAAPAPPPVPAPPPAEPGHTRAFAPRDLTEPVSAESAQLHELARERAVLVLNGVPHELEHRVFTLGRAKECDAVITDPSVSRHHAEVRLEAGEHWIVDLGSTNGTEVNGKRVDRAKLERGDTITIGQTQARFERFSQ